MAHQLIRQNLVRVPRSLLREPRTLVVQPPLGAGRLGEFAAALAQGPPGPLRIAVPDDGVVVVPDAVRGTVMVSIEGIARGPFPMDTEHPGGSVLDFPAATEFSLGGPGRAGVASLEDSVLLLRVLGPIRSRHMGDALQKLAATPQSPVVSAEPLFEGSRDAELPAASTTFRILTRGPAGPAYGRLVRTLRLSPETGDVLTASLMQRAPSPHLGLGNTLLVRFRKGVAPAVARAVARQFRFSSAAPSPIDPRIWEFRHRTADRTLLVIGERLAAYPLVEWVQPELLRPVVNHGPPEPWSALEHLLQVGAPAAWAAINQAGLKQNGVTVCVVDSDGINPNQAEFATDPTDTSPKLALAWNFAVSSPAGTVLTGGASVTGGHGDRCASSAVARRGNDPASTSGVAPHARLMAVQIPTTVTDSELASMLLWAAGIDQTSAGRGALPVSAPQVMSCSWGLATGGGSFILRSALTRIATEGRGGLGTVVVFSTGNGGPVAFDQPASLGWRPLAAHPDTISVGASVRKVSSVPGDLIQIPSSPIAVPTGWPMQTPAGGPPWALSLRVNDRAPYSQPGQSLDLVAPSHVGQDQRPILGLIDLHLVHSIDGINHYGAVFGGTSHAAAMVAGAAALVLTARPGLSATEVRDLLRHTAKKVHTQDAAFAWDTSAADPALHHSPYLGYGVVDVAAAVAEALEPTTTAGVAQPLLRDNLADDGSGPSVGDISASPDLYCTDSRSVPVLAPDATPEHTTPQLGSAIVLRVGNTGTATATQLSVSAFVSTGPFVEVSWPQGFAPPSSAGGLAPGAHAVGQAALDVPVNGMNTVAIGIPDWIVPTGTSLQAGTTAVWQPTLLGAVGTVLAPLSSTAVRTSQQLAQRGEAQVDGGEEPAAVVLGTRHPGGVRHLILTATESARALDWTLRFVPPAWNARLRTTAEQRGPLDLTSDPVMGPAVRLDFTRSAQLEIPLGLTGGDWLVALLRAGTSPAEGAEARIVVTQRWPDGQDHGGYRIVVSPQSTTDAGRGPSPERADDATCPPDWASHGSVAPWTAEAQTPPAPTFPPPDVCS